MSYEIYSDESGCSGERFRSIGTLSGLPKDIEGLRQKLIDIQKCFSVKHCEYKDINGVLCLNCAEAMLDEVVSYVLYKKIKIIILTWDMYDSRHSIIGRDDARNLDRMYYQVLKNTKRLWVDTSVDSSFYPDEHNETDFKSIVFYLERTNLTRDRKLIHTLFGREFNINFPKIINHKEIISIQDPILQSIDLLTGLGRLSHEEYDSYERWKDDEHKRHQLPLFKTEKILVTYTISKRKLYKYRLLDFVDSRFKLNKLQISLKTDRRFSSKKPSCGLWFWTYKPQGSYDKSPTN